MRYSTQLLLGIVGITVLSQTILGVIAYWIVVDADRSHLIEVLQDRAEQVAQDVVIPMVAGEPEDTALEQSRQHFSPSTDLALIIDSRNIVGIAGPDRDHLDRHVLLQTLLSSGRQPRNQSGMLPLADGDYLWVATPLIGLPYRLVLLERTETQHGTLASKLGSRLFSSGLVVLWFAVWTALLLASLVTRKLNEKNLALRHQVTHDNLTGLPNRTLLYEQLARAIAQPSGLAGNIALLVIDINRFKEINDTLGYDFGDQLLLEIGARIQACLPDNGYISRLGGNEFAVLLTDTNEQQACSHTRHILDCMNTAVCVSQVELEVGLSIGIALFPQHTDDADTLVRYADVAMHQAREHGSRYMLYDGNADTYSLRHLELSAQLRGAIDDGQFVLHYQPKLEMSSGRVAGLEALLRWEHPTHGLIPPDEFISLAEQTGAIEPLTEWVFEEALHFLRKLHKRGTKIGVAVNVSTRSLRDRRLEPCLAELLKRTGIESRFLTLEITESVMMHDISFAQGVLESLHERGIRISIDDFGTGFSSLAYLNHLPVDELKVDRSFVLAMQDSDSDQAIVQTTVELAHTLQCSVVAEGIETARSLEVLREMGCDIAQGYYISAPKPAEEIEQWLEENTAAAGREKTAVT
ncbi:MAG TPA: EAL domain-containing protein [Gammaproteobacteria bacterium]|nr:EAL domain-containing protein [Gammaproteobacteria bacterium]